MNSKIIGIAILIIAIGSASAYFLTKNDSINTDLSSNQVISQNEKIGLVINTINPPKDIPDIENSYKIASTSGVGRTNLYVHWNHLEPEKGTFDDIVIIIKEEENNDFDRRNNDLIYTHKLSLFEALSGTEFYIQNLLLNR